MKKIKIVCASCGSDDVTRDALATWDVIQQRWDIIDTLDNADCNACGGECSLREIEIVTLTVTRETADAMLAGLQEAHESREHEIGHGEHDEEDHKRNQNACDQYAKAIDELAAVMSAQLAPATT